MDRSGCTIDGFADCWATAVSLCLQSGVSLDTLYSKFAFQDFEPRGFTDNKEIHTAKSVVDYVMQWLKLNCKETVDETKKEAAVQA
jgi:ribonucleoside-diphosphate reductase alpha chain